MMSQDQKNFISLLNELTKGSLMSNLAMEFTVAEEGYVEAQMPVDERTCQHMRLLHGGASLAFAETLAGLGSYLLCEEGEIAVGMQVSGSHISSAFFGELVTGKAKLVHKGRTSHVWDVEILNSKEKLVSAVRVTNSIIKRLK